MKGIPIGSLLVLSHDDVQHLVTMSECIDLMRIAFRELSSGKVQIPQRMVLGHPEYHGTSLFMPGYSPHDQLIGIKIVTLFRNNWKSGIPLINGLVLIFDATSGRPLALLDAEHLTALRTGAASGLATDLLARADAHIVVIFGAGTQAEFQLMAVNEVRPIKKAYIHDPDSAKANEFCINISTKLNIEIEFDPDPSVVRKADIICTATSSAIPVFKESDVKPGTHINAIGSYKPDKTEIPNEIVIRSKIVVDSRPAALAEAGEIVQAIRTGKLTADSIFAEIGELLIRPDNPRANNTEITLFKSVGNAIQDLVTAQLMIERAQERDVGTNVSI